MDAHLSYQVYLATNPEAIPPPMPDHPDPSIRLWFEQGNRQHEVTQSPYCQPVCELVSLALRQLCYGQAAEHLLLILKQIAGTSIAVSHLGERKQLAEADIRGCLLDEPLDFVLKRLPDNSNGNIVWGEVVKGAGKSEIAINIELAAAICDPAPPTFTDSNAVSTGLRFLLFVTIFHEVVHVITNKIFVQLITPPLPSFEQDDDGHGEAGDTLEMRFFGFITLVSLGLGDVNASDRLWRIQEFTAYNRINRPSRILDAQTMEAILSSVKNMEPWGPLWNILPETNFDPSTQRRMRRNNRGGA
ncbi:hypothetical protein MIND_00153100 [Mycena indigotica]|uniref:Uncharacterized protein n=1 Tax=Mycena indigotica TaxID=2126181 RepID=A0A8H6TEP6_9AGAR|nr:uncharacterized protein MIND_00153100 [Mycena indigotica]KAF7316343.1 hypothetical protein MIND_00153100 [Mycena indigotica]